jgi:hypothetical protein
MTAPLLILVGADKGGVGKTTVCRVLCDYMDAKLIDMEAPRVIDTQIPKGELRKFRTTADLRNITNIADQMDIFNDMKGVTIVDLGAGLLSFTMNAFDEAHLLDDVRDGTLRVALLHVLGPTVTSLDEIEDALRVLGISARHIIVKNHINETTFFEWDEDSRYATTLRALESSTVNIPNLKSVCAEMIQASPQSFQAFAEQKKNRLLSGYVRTWLDRCWAEFERVGLAELMRAK